METRKTQLLSAMVMAIVLLLISACGMNQTIGDQQAMATPTPTELVMDSPPTITAAPSPCEGLSGTLEVQVVVGPAEAVGLEPVSIGSIPWAVTGTESPYFVQGQGPLSYEATLAEEWGTYTVVLEMDLAVFGNCEDTKPDGELILSVEMTGEQLVEVKAEGFHGKYPWSGTETREFLAPIQEGYSMSGEGYVFVLHLK